MTSVEPITVACVLRSGGVYNGEWVARLKRGVDRYLSLPHRFVCLTDMPVDCESIPLVEPWKGWWSKVALFAPGLLSGRVLYFDLDSIIVGSLDRMAEYPHKFTMSHDFYNNNPCSTAMAWDASQDGQRYSFIFDTFKKNADGYAKYYDDLLHKEKRIGDQAFIEDCLKKRAVPIDFFQNVTGRYSVASYKVDKCHDAPPNDAAVVAFHGRPKPSELKTGWVPKAWR